MNAAERRLLLAVARAVRLLFEPLLRGRPITAGQAMGAMRELDGALADVEAAGPGARPR